MAEAEKDRVDYDIRVYIEAVKLAHEAHGEQKYGQYPYTRHLAHVENVLSRFSFTDLDLLAAAWLHDSLEDKTGLTVESIIDRLGSATIARLVSCVTDGEGRNRKERKAASYAKMREYPWAVPLKLADRIANVESCLMDEDGGLLSMYRKEHAEFRAQLHHVSLTIGAFNTRVRAMWAYLEHLLTDESPITEIGATSSL